MQRGGRCFYWVAAAKSWTSPGPALRELQSHQAEIGPLRSEMEENHDNLTPNFRVGDADRGG
ncbi:hypothetical protein CCMA1212_009180 [Trichoderma ghanense]|uniref:Uncharacterized protein n=1 Tax=Trichoderma ghanense TaxID=65468 RepID=A0ABY2GUV9_9HYPO